MVHLPAAVERRLRVIFHATPTGREPVREWLRTLSKEERRTIGEDIEFLQRSWPVERPYAAHLRNAVWEVRTSCAIGRHGCCSVWTEGRWSCCMDSSRRRDRRRRLKSRWLNEDFRSISMARRNPHAGSDFDDFLREEGILEEVQAKAIKRVLAEQIRKGMAAANISKVRMAQLMATSRSQLDRVLDPENVAVQLDTLLKAAHAVGKTVDITLRNVSNGYAPEERRFSTRS
jgi:hypothetical protein